FNHLVLGAVPLASLGDRGRLEEYWAELDRTRLGRGTREAAMLAVAAAAPHVLDHDEPAPARAPADHPAPHPPTHPARNMPPRRCVAIGSLLSPAARRAWAAQPLGRSHLRVRQAARQLAAAREGRLRPDDELTPADLALTAFPLPWSVELAAWAQAVGHPEARRLAERLAGYAGAAAHEELGWPAARPPGAARRGGPHLP